MLLGYIKDENGKLVRKFVREGEEHNPEFLFKVSAEFGDYIWTDEDHIEEAKAALLENMFDVIRKLSKMDEFWVVKYPDLVNAVPQEAYDGNITVAWRAAFPQMEGFYPFEEREQIQKRIYEQLSNQ